MTKRKRGRPAFKPTPAMRRKVAVAAGGGMPHEDIALALGISHVTLGKYFEYELSIGAARKRMEVLEALQREAKDGKVAAIRMYLENGPQVSVPPGEQPAHAAEQQKPEHKGKKEQAQEDAATAHLADPEWRDLLGKPRTVQ